MPTSTLSEDNEAQAGRDHWVLGDYAFDEITLLSHPPCLDRSNSFSRLADSHLPPLDPSKFDATFFEPPLPYDNLQLPLAQTNTADFGTDFDFFAEYFHLVDCFTPPIESQSGPAKVDFPSVKKHKLNCSIPVLPNELYIHIIEYALNVSDEDFRCEVYKSPFGRQAAPAINILLVCKFWYRWARPVLFECLVFRSTPQVRSFMNMLRSFKKDKTGQSAMLVKRIRRVRLESCFCLVLRKAFEMVDASTIEEFFIGFPQEENKKAATGSCQMLSLINPRHVVVGVSERRNGVRALNYTQTEEALCNNTKQWTRLHTFEMVLEDAYYITFSSTKGWIDNLPRNSAGGLRLCFRIKSSPQALLNEYLHRELLQRVRCYEEDCYIRSIELTVVAEYHKLTAEVWNQIKLKYSSLKKTSISLAGQLVVTSAPATTLTLPMVYSTRAPDASFSKPADQMRLVDVELERLGHITSKEAFDNYQMICKRSALISPILEDYCNRKASEVLYAENRVSLQERADELLQIDPKTGQGRFETIKSLVFGSDWHVLENGARYDVVADFLLFSLQGIESVCISIDSLRLWSDVLCPGQLNNLRTLSLNGLVNDINVAELIEYFPRLEHLSLFGGKPLQKSSTLSSSSFPKEYVGIKTIKFDNSLEALDFFAKSTFPSAHSLCYQGNLADLLHVSWSAVLRRFPNLHEVRIKSRIVPIRTTESNMTVKKIIIDEFIYCPLDLKLALESINLDHFPSLEEVQFGFTKEWAWKDVDLGRHFEWTEPAKRTILKYPRLRFTNYGGVQWRPKLYKKRNVKAKTAPRKTVPEQQTSESCHDGV